MSFAHFWYRWHVPSQGLDVRHRPDARIAITLESTTLNSSRALTPYDRWLRSMERCPLLEGTLTYLQTVGAATDILSAS